MLALSRAVTFDKSASNGAEGLTPAVLAVSLTAASDTSVSVDYSATGGMATPGDDYTLPSGTLVFGPGEIRKHISIDILADGVAEGDETIEVTLSNPIGAIPGLITVHTYTINEFGIIEREVLDAEPEEENDRIDRIRMVASAALNDDFSDLAVTVADHMVTGFDPGVAGDAEFFVLLEEKTEPDTGAPDVQITANTKLQASATGTPIPADTGPNTPSDAVPPVVASTSPEDGANPVSVRTEVALTFSEAMDRLSTETAFSIDGGVTGSFAWPAADTLVFTPSERLANATTHTVTIETGAQDLAGNVIASAHVFSFTTGGGLLVEIPSTSTTSPAFIEGEYWQAEGEDYPIIGNGPEGDVAANVLDERRFFVDIPLEQGDNTVSVRQEGTVPLVQVTDTVTWEPTYIDDDSAQSIVIRKGDSLLLSAWEEGGTILEIDDGKGGGFQTVPGGPGDTLQTLYDAADEYIAEAKIDSVSVGTLTIVVIEVDLSSPIACHIGHKREKDVPIAPAAYASEVLFGTTDPSLLEVSVKELTGTGATIYLRALQHGTPVLTARIGSEAGPIVAYREVDEFTLYNTARYLVTILHVPGEGDDRSGRAMLTMDPLVPGIEMEMEMRSAGSTFEGGLSEFRTSSDDFILQPDGSGKYIYRIHVAPGYDAFCFDVHYFQTSSQRAHVSLDSGENGALCEAWAWPEPAKVNGEGQPVETYVVNEEEEFRIHAKAHDKNHDVTFSVTLHCWWTEYAEFGTFDCGDETDLLVSTPAFEEGQTEGTMSVYLSGHSEVDSDYDSFDIPVLQEGSMELFGPDNICVGHFAIYEVWQCVDGTAQTVSASWSVTGGGSVSPSTHTGELFLTMGTAGSSARLDTTVTAVTAEGTISKQVTVWEIESSTDEVAPSDSNHERKNLGVCERVKLTIKPQETVTWTQTGNGFYETDPHTWTIWYEASQTPESATIKVKTSDGISCSKTFTVLAPNGVTIQRIGTLVHHKLNSCSAGFLGKITLTPDNVCFGRLEVREMGVWGSGTDYFAPYTFWHKPWPDWVAVAVDNKVAGEDHIGSGLYTVSSDWGVAYFDIPIYYRKAGQTQPVLGYKFADVTQMWTSSPLPVAAGGTCTISKGGAQAYAEWDWPTTYLWDPPWP